MNGVTFAHREVESRHVSPVGCWLLFLSSLFRPGVTLGFLATGPHPTSVILAWLSSVAGSLVIERAGGKESKQPPPVVPRLWFDALLCVIFAMQLANFILLGRFLAAEGFWSFDAFAALLLSGLSSGYATVIVAHELIHRQSRGMQAMGRILLSLVFYEHWFTEHLRAHHVNVGRYDDAGSARFGESYAAFCVRSIPGQFRNAWRLEAKRLAAVRSGSGRLVRNRIVHGILMEFSWITLTATMWGAAALTVLLMQAGMAILLLEAVDYFAHWGLERTTPDIQLRHAWDTDSRMTLYAFVGLSRHADHHLHVFRPYYKLQRYDESPKLPYGYPGMALLAMFQNRRFQQIMTAELERYGLRPQGSAHPSSEALESFPRKAGDHAYR